MQKRKILLACFLSTSDKVFQGQQQIEVYNKHVEKIKP